MTQHAFTLTDPRSASTRQRSSARVETFGQYMTPLWVAEAIVDRYFGDLPAQSHVLEPSCGIGRFLDALRNIRPDLIGTGIEIDPKLAAEAIARGHYVTNADFLTTVFARTVHAVIGNPPFASKTIDAFLKRAHELLHPGGVVGFILPTYYFQAATRTDALTKRWSLFAEQIPRSIFPGLSEPLCFAVLTKDERKTMVGFAFYGTAAAIQRWGREYRDVAIRGRGRGVSVWRSVVDTALTNLGGEADLPTLYAAIEGNRPTPNPHWRAKVRQIVQLECVRTGPARWARKAA